MTVLLCCTKSCVLKVQCADSLYCNAAWALRALLTGMSSSDLMLAR